MSLAAPRRLVLLAAVTAMVGGCGGAATGTLRSPEPSGPGAQPIFDLALAGAVALPPYTSDPTASLNECAPSSTGGWSYLYAGGTPFVTLQLSVYSPATSGANPADFDLDIVTPGTRAIRVVPSGRREGIQGDGAIRVDPRPDGGVTMSLDGTAVTLDGGPVSVGETTVHLEIACPADP